MQRGYEDGSAREAAPGDAALERALDAFAARAAERERADLPEEAYDDRDYHALAQGFHAARRDMLDAERGPAALHAFPHERPSDASPAGGAPRSAARAAQRIARTTLGSTRGTIWAAAAAIAAGLTLIAWSAFGPRLAASGQGGAAEALVLGNLRGGESTLALRVEREDEALHFLWSGKLVGPASRTTLRVYPQGSLRAVFVRQALTGDRVAIPRDELPEGACEAEVELETETGVAPASPRVAFER
jgi:hypothetical protein